ncbi:hypothetical protein V6N13_046991 [Hibiscus sabdariffa]|uniref:AN1-type domain-containing protein n=2 Tax=Hibiscus sabdariffa TaxID=183260 RepID=A0ABR1Z7V7_9ROSI
MNESEINSLQLVSRNSKLQTKNQTDSFLDHTISKLEPNSKIPSHVSSSSIAVEQQATVVVVTADEPAERKLANMCIICRKKVGLTRFKCRCESTFCGKRRYPEKHECSFDFKGVGHDAIAKANPVVKADKVNRF